MQTTTRVRSALTLSAGLGLAFLAPPAAAQAALPGGGQWTETFPTTAGQFERTERADLDGDGVSDMVVQRGTSIEVLLAPGLYDQPLIVPASVTAYGICPVAPTTSRSLLLISNALGLEQVELDASSGTWKSKLIAASWSDAALIEVHDMVGTVAVLGVMADQRTVRCLYRLADQWFEQPVLVHPEPIRDLTVFEFDGGGQIEIAVASDSALWVYDSLGTLRKSFPVGDAQSVAIGTLDLPLTVRDGLAWVVTRSEGLQQLIVLAPNGLQAPLHLSTLPLVVDMETGDIDQDGDSDIVLSHTIEHSVAVLINSGNGWLPAFDVKGTAARKVQYGPEGVPATGNSARPKLADVDGDKDNDLLMPVQSSGELFVWCSSTIDQETYEPEVDVSAPEASCNLEALGNGDLAMHLELAVDLPDSALATHIEIVVWRRDCPEEATQHEAVERVLVPIAGNEPQVLSSTLILPQVPDLVPGTNVRFEGIYVWLQRAVRVYEGNVSHRWPARVYAIETSPQPQNYSWIKSIGGKMLFPIHECANGSTLPDLIGCGSELPKLPEFPGGKVPTWI